MRWALAAAILAGCVRSPPPPPKFYGRVCSEIFEPHREWVLKCVSDKGDDSGWVEACAYEAEKLFCPLRCFQYETYEKIPCNDPNWQAVLESE